MTTAPDSAISQAIAALNQGQIIAYPTEHVFGLGVDAKNECAVKKLCALKQRPLSKGLISVCADWRIIEHWLQPLSEKHIAQMQASWPGPVTWLLPANEKAPPWLTGSHKSIALRVSAHPVVARLCQRFGGAIVSTSANPASLAAAKTAAEVAHYFADLSVIIDQAVGDSEKPSRIIDLLSGKILRT